MSDKFTPPATSDAAAVPFNTAEEAWFWGVQGLKARLDGARMRPGMATTVRPCEASDVLNCADRLRRERRLSRQQCQVLVLYGQYAAAPSAFGDEHRAAAPLWDSAMRELEAIFEQKGII